MKPFESVGTRIVNQKRVQVMGPIVRDDEFERAYIPLPGGWELQTKGKGSTMRLVDPEGVRLAIPESPYLQSTLEAMAMDIHAALYNKVLYGETT